MNTTLSGRLFAAGAFAAALSACSGSGSQPPLETRTAQKASVFGERGAVVPSSATRSMLSLSNCTAVATSKGPLTAAVVANGAPIVATVDASGCDVGIYLGPTSSRQSIDHTTVHDANQYGIFADQAQQVTIDHTQVYNIGNHDNTGFAPNGVQTGVGLYFRGASGSVDHTDIFKYQKNGTAFNCLFDSNTGACLKPSTVSMEHSTATGLGVVNYIAQNGIQYYDSNAPVFDHNSSINNSYQNPQDPIYNGSATGYLFLCTNVPSQQQLIDWHNAASGNDYNYYVDNVPSDC